MKLLFTFLLPIYVLCTSLTAVEYGQLYSTSIHDPDELVAGTFVSLNNGDLFELLSFSSSSNYPVLYGKNGADVIMNLTFSDLLTLGSRLQIAGPCKVWVYAPSIHQGAASYKITRASEIAQSSTPVNTVVIPTDANGDVEIILESSVDLVNWTAATPGQYSAATENRFFRIRAVETGN